MEKIIMFIEDNKDILEAVQLFLEDAGFKVIAVDNGDYIDKLDKSLLPGIVIVDMLLSGTDGQAVIKKLKSREETRNIPVVLTSAHPQAKNRWKQFGADDFLPKPFDIDVLLALINKHI